MSSMVKDAFERLPAQRRESILQSGMQLYLSMPYEQITIRVLVKTLGINMATFYRYFSEKDDLCLLILRHIMEKFASLVNTAVFDAFAPSPLTQQENDFLNLIHTWPEALLQRVYFEANREVSMPLVQRQLQLARLDHRLRDDVVDDFVAYLYVTLEYTLMRYLQQGGGYDEKLFVRLKDYMLHSLLPHGILCKPQDGEPTL